METKNFSYNEKKVTKVNLLVIYGTSLFTLFQTLITSGISDKFMTNLIKVLIVIAFTTIVNFLPVKEKVKGCILSAIVCLVAWASILSNVTIQMFFLIIISFIMSVLYLNTTLIVVSTSYINILLIILFIIKPATFHNNVSNLYGFFALLIYFNTIAVLLFSD